MLWKMKKKRQPKVIATYKTADILYMMLSSIGGNDPDFKQILQQTTGYRLNNKLGTFELIQHPIKNGVYDTISERTKKG